MDLFVIPGDGWLRSERASSKVPDTKSRLVRAKRERTFTWHGSRAHTGSRRRALGKMLLIIGLLVVSLSARGMVSTATSSLQPHAPIVINGNSDFNPSNGVTGGSGTASDPYMIQGWNISSSGCCSTIPGISINNTSAYFIIRNVYLNAWPSPGIITGNVTNGVIRDSHAWGYPWGMILDSSRNILVSNDTVPHHVSTSSSDNITFANDSISSLFISSSKNVTIVDDQLLWFAPWCGACVDNSSNVNISGSTFYGCDCAAVAVSNSDHVSLTGNNIASDTVLSVSRSSFVEISDNQMSWGIDHGVSLVSCSAVLFQGNNVRESTDQYPLVKIDGCKGVDISGNIIAPMYSVTYKLDLLGITRSSNVTIEGNDLSNATTALSITASSDILVDANNIQSNAQGLILNNTANVQVFHNNFLNNTLQAQDTNSTQNVWDNSYPSGGNFWSDYSGVDNCSGPQQNICPSPDGIGDTPYTFNNNQDNYPLMQLFAPDPPAAVATAGGGGGGGGGGRPTLRT